MTETLWQQSPAFCWLCSQNVALVQPVGQGGVGFTPFPSEAMQAVGVSTTVNCTRNQGPGSIEPLKV
jgi:hypothetical protein